MIEIEKSFTCSHRFLFDKGIKKVCRYNQYYAIKRAQKRLTDKNCGGIIWHTQGSGKSLSMVWLSKWILANNPNARVLVITDREELDEQIEKTYIGVDVKVGRTKSGKDLIEKLNSFEDRLICSLIHKFGKRGGEIKETDYDKYVEDLYASLPKDFSVKGDVTICAIPENTLGVANDAFYGCESLEVIKILQRFLAMALLVWQASPVFDISRSAEPGAS